MDSDTNGEEVSAPTDYEDLALQLAEAGYPVFPAREQPDPIDPDRYPQKAPYVNDWETRATRDPEKIEEWWRRWPNALPAIPPGRVGLTVIDLDSHADRVSGLDTAALNGFAVHARVERTSFSGLGRHLWYRGQDYSLNGLFDGIDRKSVGGYVVVPYTLPDANTVSEPLPEYYRGGREQQTGQKNEQNVRDWLLQHGGKMSPLVQGVVDSLPDPFVGHQLLIEKVRTLVGYGARDYAGAGTGLIELGKKWVAAEHASGDPNDEFEKAVVGAIRKFGTETTMELSKLLGGKDTETVVLPGSFTSEELLAEEFPPVTWVVPGVIPEGLTVLIANPKIGKSWLVLGIATALANGEDMLGVIPGDGKRPVLYLALEDSKRSLQSRLDLINATPSRNLHFAVQLPQDQIVETIRAFLELNADRHPVCILDTLGRAMPLNESGANAYHFEYAFTAALKGIIPPGGSLILVHHTNKVRHEDFLLSVSGTQGIAGAADTILMLKRERNDPEATLLVTSREVSEAELMLRFDKGSWTLTGVGESLDGHELSALLTKDIHVDKEKLDH